MLSFMAYWRRRFICDSRLVFSDPDRPDHIFFFEKGVPASASIDAYGLLLKILR
jgi:hypothetical protein